MFPLEFTVTNPILSEIRNQLTNELVVNDKRTNHFNFLFSIINVTVITNEMLLNGDIVTVRHYDTTKFRVLFYYDMNHGSSISPSLISGRACHL